MFMDLQLTAPLVQVLMVQGIILDCASGVDEESAAQNTAGQRNYAFYANGTAPSVFQGIVSVGTNTPPTKDRRQSKTVLMLKVFKLVDASNDWTLTSGVVMVLHVAIGYGYIGSNGSYNLDFMCNGYRNAAGEWTTLNINGNVGRANISLSPQLVSIDFRVLIMVMRLH